KRFSSIVTIQKGDFTYAKQVDWLYWNRCYGKKYGEKLTTSRIYSPCIYTNRNKSSIISRRWSHLGKISSQSCAGNCHHHQNGWRYSRCIRRLFWTSWNFGKCS